MDTDLPTYIIVEMAKSATSSPQGSRPTSAYNAEKMMTSDKASMSSTDHSGGKDIEKGEQVVRKLKSRHLQMIAIGMILYVPTIHSFLTSNRWYNWYGFVHRIWWCNRQVRSSRCTYCLRLRRNTRVQCYGLPRRDGNLHSHPGSIHLLRISIY